jgi:hypothetical protein
MSEILIAGLIVTNLILCAWIMFLERRLCLLNYTLYSIAIGDATATLVDETIVINEEK